MIIFTINPLDLVLKVLPQVSWFLVQVWMFLLAMCEHVRVGTAVKESTLLPKIILYPLKIYSQRFEAKFALIQVLLCMNSCFVLLCVSLSLEALRAVLALMNCWCFVDKLDVPLQSIQIRWLFTAVMTSVVQMLRLVVLHMLLVRLLIGYKMQTYMTSQPILRSFCVDLRVLL